MFALDELGYEQLVTHVVTLREQESDSKFLQGELLAYAIDFLKAKAQDMAAELNCSGAQIRELAKTYRAFPDPEDRIPYATLSYYHFRIAANTLEPKKWLDLAADTEMSTRELQQAIKGEVVKDEFKEAERIYGKVERYLESEGPGPAYLVGKLVHLVGTPTQNNIQEEQETEQQHQTVC